MTEKKKPGRPPAEKPKAATKKPTVTKEGAGKIHKSKTERWQEGDVIEGHPDAIADLVRRGFVHFV